MPIEPGSILVVDDTPANLQVLTQLLTQHGHHPRAVPSGEIALSVASREAPDLILLDINMPDMDGFETCKRFKEDEALRDIPILFISARTDTDDKLRGFQAGGVDYITKPFDLDEVIARVDTHLKLRSLQREVATSYKNLQQMEALRDNLVHMLVHDMRTPLSVMRTSLSMLKDEISADLSEDNRLDLEDALGGTESLIKMVNDLLDVSQMEAGMMPLERRRTNIVAIATEAVERVQKLAQQIDLSMDSEDEILVECDPGIVDRILSNFLHNAVKFTPAGGSVVVTISKKDGFIETSVTDTGPGIPEEFQEHVFNKFGQTKEARRYTSSGLGLTFCKMAIEAHQGEIGVESDVGTGSRFWFTLPDQPEEVRSEQ